MNENMIKLPNKCYCGKLTVYPKNFEDNNASLEKAWNISYRFYDPKFKKEFPKGKQRIVKGMNHHSTVIRRRKATNEIMELELDKLIFDGFNPITHEANTTAKILHGDFRRRAKH